MVLTTPHFLLSDMERNKMADLAKFLKNSIKKEVLLNVKKHAMRSFGEHDTVECQLCRVREPESYYNLNSFANGRVKHSPNCPLAELDNL